MADFARFLPLSQRQRHDESGATGDRRTELAGVIAQAASLVRAAESGRTVFAGAFADAAGLRTEVAELGHAEPADGLDALAAAVRTGRRRSIRALVGATRALFALARDLGAEVALEPMTAGAVALYAATTAPLERRAVVRGHTVRATDADWAFGTGPVLEGTATGIAAFLLGASDEPPVSPRR